MQLQLGRRLVSPPPLPQGGQHRSRRPPVGGGSGDGVDRISDLPDELLVDVLGRLRRIREAARTSVLSHWWRDLWTGLCKLEFINFGADKIENVLARVQPELSRLNIDIEFDKGPNLTGASISSLLRAADRVAPAELVVRLFRGYSPVPVTFEIPSFESAASILLGISMFKFTLAPGGEFVSLEQLTLELEYCTVDFSALLPRCPRLQKLRMNLYMDRPIGTILVESMSLKDVQFRLRIDGPGSVAIVAPELKYLVLDSIVSEEFTVSPSVPKKYHTAKRSFVQEIARLPVNDFSVLNLSLNTLGHDFGPLVLQVLQIRTSIRRLRLILYIEKMFQKCSENCDCDQGGNWRTEPLSLPDLEDVEIQGFSANGHEVDFLELVFRSAPMLKRVTIQLSKKVPTDNGGRQRLDSMFEANASVKCSVHDTPDEKDW